MVPPAWPAPVVPGAADVPGAPVPARARRAVVVVVAAGGDHGTDERHREADDRPAADEVAAADPPLAYGSTRSRWTGPTLRRTRSSASNPLGSSPDSAGRRRPGAPAAGRTIAWPPVRALGSQPVRGSSVSAIARIEISHHRLPLDPPFPASWDPRPRRRSRRRSCASSTTPAASASGRATRCTGSPTTSAGSSARTRWTSSVTVPCSPTSTSTPVGPWPLDVALWDLAGQILDRPVWYLVGGQGQRRAHLRLVGCPAAGRRRWPTSPDGAVDAGFPALKVRFGRPRPRRRPGRRAGRPRCRRRRRSR